MSWSDKNIAKLKKSWKDRDLREQCFKPTPKCPACGEQTFACELFKKPGGEKASSLLTEDSNMVVCDCPQCGEELLVSIQIPRPTYSTYVVTALPEDDEAPD